MKPVSWLAYRFARTLFLCLLAWLGNIAASHAASKTELAQQILHLMHWPDLYRQVMTHELARVTEIVTAIPSDEAKRVAILEAYKREAEGLDMVAFPWTAGRYEENFQEDELAQIAAFYRTDAGQRFCAFQVRMMLLMSSHNLSSPKPSPEETARAQLFLDNPEDSYRQEVPNGIDEETAAFFASPAGKRLLQKLDTISILTLAETQKAVGGAMARTLPKRQPKP
jgi:hypothetical protein